MKNVTAIVISFLRPDYTIACIQSLRKVYPAINIIVGENGHYSAKLAYECTQVQAKYVELPYDSGVCVARNRLLEQVTTEYVLVGDDDFFYTPDTGVERMHTLLDRHPEIDLIGGRIIENDVVRNYQGSIEITGRHLVNTPINLDTAPFEYDEVSDLRYIKTDLVFNFFVARVASIKNIPWDEQIKVAYEHSSWFIDLKKAGVHVAFSPEPIVIHKPVQVRMVVEQQTDAHNAYRTYRMRRGDKERFFTRHNLDYVVDMNGHVDYSPTHIVEVRKNDTKYVDFCVTTYMRPHALRRLLLSIAEYYPMANIYVADQNEVLDREFYKTLRAELFKAGLVKRLIVEKLPYDCGLSYARNHLVTTTPNIYKLILDDDTVFTADTNIGKMITLMESGQNIGVVGGLLTQLGTEVHFEFTPEKIGDTIYHTPDTINWKTYRGIRYRKTGCVLNFALMRADVFKYTTWDDNLKVTEHLDFYMRFKDNPYAIVYTPDVIIDHPPVDRSDGYKEMRQRPEFQVHMMQKHGVKRVKYGNGQVVELEPGGGLKRYKEQPL